MLSTLIHAILFILLAVHHVTADLEITTPELTQCQDAIFDVTGGSSKFYLYVVAADDPCGEAIVSLPQMTGNSLNWKVNIPAGSKVEVVVQDSEEEEEGWTGTMVVRNSSDASCIGKNAANLPDSLAAPSAAASALDVGVSSEVTYTPLVSAASPLNTVVPSGVVGSPANAAHGSSKLSGAISTIAFPASSLLATAAAFLIAIA